MNDRPERVQEDGSDTSRAWTFAKGGDELIVEQWIEGDAVTVILTRSDEAGTETRRVYDFADERAAEEFRSDLDQSLLQFGWIFIGYLPNRRRRHDRRSDLRSSDRRRWWTDGGTFLE
jgi:hypothetical protein